MRVEDVVRIIRQTIRPIKNKILLSIGRGILLAAKDDKGIQQVQLTLLADEVKDQVESMAHFGFSSRPPKGSDLVMVSVGGNRDHGIVVASEHRESRFKNLAEGDSVLYNVNGKYIHLKGDNIEALVSKLKIENDSHEMVAVLSEFMQEVIDGLVFTAIGPQPWIPATKTKLEAVKTKLDTFKE